MKSKYLSALRAPLTALCLYIICLSFANANPKEDYLLTDAQRFRQAYNFIIYYVHNEVVRLSEPSVTETFSPQSDTTQFSKAEFRKNTYITSLVWDGLNAFFMQQAEQTQSTSQQQKKLVLPPDRMSLTQLIEEEHRREGLHHNFVTRLMRELETRHKEKKIKMRYLTGMLKARADKPFILDKKEVLEQRDAMITAAEAANKMFGEARRDQRTLDNDSVEAIEPGGSSNPDNVKRVEAIITPEKWEFIFPQRDKKYTYLNFLKGIGKYPALCQTYTDGKNSNAICTRALATMFAHFTQETGAHTPGGEVPQWRQGLFYLREVGWTEEAANGYGICDPTSWQGKAFPCGKFPNGQYKSYFGRGAKQLSYNYNYGPFSISIYNNVRTLLNSPERVADTWLNLASAAFFYTFPAPPKPNMLSVMDGRWEPNSVDLAGNRTPGFGVTTMIINGGVECGGPTENIQSKNRIEYYKKFAEYLEFKIPEDERLGCANMKQFDANSSAAINIYWDQDYTWNPNNPNGLSYRCKLVSYQTAYNAFTEGDYIKCLVDKFNVVIKDDGGNIPPRAYAGGDLTVMAPESGFRAVNLDGRESKAYANNKITHWEWSQIGTADRLDLTNQNSDIATVNVQAMTSETPMEYQFQLEITDDKGGKGLDTMSLVVTPYSHGEPIGIELESENTVAPLETVKVTAILNDSDLGKTLDYQWSSSRHVSLETSPDKTFVTFNAPATTVMVDVIISLVVKDENGNRGRASKTIAVVPSDGRYPAWKEGTIYHGGSRVSCNGVDYECRSFPFSGWCGQSASHYQPGRGSHWQDAWKRIEEKD
ncbi:chitinase [Endozoicomonas lisbonensis]|uniref:Chitodextrinase n=1 Tax=Endozoicomonas lisbonensis TaxID=3120522 RepID=A0ABV2SCT0_9GAMM